MNFIITLLLLVLILGLIILVHEFGHFIAAKKSGVYVEEFSLGMGPVIWQKKPKNSETTYSIRALPIGGYVAMAEKMDPENKKIKKDRVLENKGFLKNIWVMINGVAMNFILAVFIFFISGLFYGKPVATSPQIMQVVEGSAAEKYGLEAGDTILSVNGVKVNNAEDFQYEVQAKKLKANYELELKKSNGDIVKKDIIPDLKEANGTKVPSFGIAISGTKYEKGFLNAVSYAFTGVYDTTKTILKILGSLVVGEVSVDNLSGPVGMYSLIDQVKTTGLQNILYLIAYLSINVGIINLIPIPVFDGGRILMLCIEKVTKRKANQKLELLLTYIGFGLMILLMLYVTFNDIIRLVVG